MFGDADTKPTLTWDDLAAIRSQARRWPGAERLAM
jgi:hypothetical protein